MADGPRDVQMRSRGLSVRFEQELGRHNACTAVIEDPVIDLRLHRGEIATPRIGPRIGTAEADKMDAKMAKRSLPEFGIRARSS